MTDDQLSKVFAALSLARGKLWPPANNLPIKEALDILEAEINRREDFNCSTSLSTKATSDNGTR